MHLFIAGLLILLEVLESSFLFDLSSSNSNRDVFQFIKGGITAAACCHVPIMCPRPAQSLWDRCLSQEQSWLINHRDHCPIGKGPWPLQDGCTLPEPP